MLTRTMIFNNIEIAYENIITIKRVWNAGADTPATTNHNSNCRRMSNG
jgi:hypothetical protein